MESISVFDIFKIGVGPSSSHTLGPWRAARLFLELVRARTGLEAVERVRVDLFGSLAKTGKGHGTDIAVQLGLMDFDPKTFDTESLGSVIRGVHSAGVLRLGSERGVRFSAMGDIAFHFHETLPFHPNGLRFTASLTGGGDVSETYYSVGGGFVVTEDEVPGSHRTVNLPYPAETGADVLAGCGRGGCSVASMVRLNELVWREEGAIDAGLDELWETMLECLYRGCTTEGVLPGGLEVERRAAGQMRALLDGKTFGNRKEWLSLIKRDNPNFEETLRWISVFALAVNEENAAFGRVVTAPTNGAAGVIPAVVMYGHCFLGFDEGAIREFLLVSGQIGILFKKGATISAAMGGCMAEIGVSSAMAAGALAHCLGADAARVLMAAEIAMEHHLGMTCDPVMGLVQVPCIERNTMGAVKAITAANMVLTSDPSKAKVSFDDVVKTMWETALDMSTKYKETSEGGLASQISVLVPEC